MRISTLFIAVPVVALLACSSSPEDVASSSADLITPFCPGGNCPPPPSCSFEYPTLATGEAVWVESWSVLPADGQCPVIQGTGGSWANMWSVPNPAPPGIDYDIDGVPGDYTPGISGIGSQPSCNQILGTSATCCTYVWWPTGWPEGEQTPATPQDTQALCTANNRILFPLTKWDCPDSSQTQRPGHLPSCPLPGTGGCTTCVVVRGP